jgi:hypothetical protein
VSFRALRLMQRQQQPKQAAAATKSRGFQPASSPIAPKCSSLYTAGSIGKPADPFKVPLLEREATGGRLIFIVENGPNPASIPTHDVIMPARADTRAAQTPHARSRDQANRVAPAETASLPRQPRNPGCLIAPEPPRR